MRHLILIALLLMAGSANAWDSTLTYRPGASQIDGNSIISNTNRQDWNYGADEHLKAGEYFAVIGLVHDCMVRAPNIWDTLDNHSWTSDELDSVWFGLRIADDQVATGDSLEITWYNMADANADWVEGTGSGSSDETNITDDGATWDYADATPTAEAWAGSEGCETATTDYDTPELGHYYHGDTASITTNDTLWFRITAAVVNGWETTNTGLIIKGDPIATQLNSCYYDFYSDDYWDSQYHPVIRIFASSEAAATGQIF